MSEQIIDLEQEILNVLASEERPFNMYEISAKIWEFISSKELGIIVDISFKEFIDTVKKLIDTQKIKCVESYHLKKTGYLPHDLAYILPQAKHSQDMVKNG
jgi:hypothetical protein